MNAVIVQHWYADNKCQLFFEIHLLSKTIAI